jgi:hypothetical protein
MSATPLRFSVSLPSESHMWKLNPIVAECLRQVPGFRNWALGLNDKLTVVVKVGGGGGENECADLAAAAAAFREVFDRHPRRGEFSADTSCQNIVWKDWAFESRALPQLQ